MAETVPLLIRLDDPLTLKEKDDGWAPDKNNLNVLQARGYIIGETIGEGKYSKIKKAFCVRTNETVAVKIIYKSKLRPRDHRKFIAREIGILTNVYHPGMLDVIQLFESDKMYLITMEYAPNGDLTDYINKMGHLSEADARRLFKQLLDVVSFLHENNICHRDIKCDNILLDKNFNLKLADFDFACTVPDKSFLETNCGSYVYCAPEVLDGHKYNGFAADVWSMGVCLYSMLCGKLPYRDDDIDILLYCMEKKLKFTRHVSKDCKDLLMKMMNYDPVMRPVLSEIYKHNWMCKPLTGIGVSSMSSMAIKAVTEDHVEFDPTEEHGFNCDQYSTSTRPSRVSHVLQTVAQVHSTGESTVDLRKVSNIKKNSSAAITGVAGPIGRRLSEQIMGTEPGSKLKNPKNLLSRFKRAAKTVAAVSRFRRGPLNTILNMPQEQALRVIREKHIDDNEHETKALGSCTSGKVAKHCQDVKFMEYEEKMKPIREVNDLTKAEEEKRNLLHSTVCHLLPDPDELNS